MIPINPTLPPDFDNTPNDRRPDSHREWWYRPFIVTYDAARLGWSGGADLERWLKSWPSGTRYDVRCLDGGAWDRSTNHGSFATMDGAVTRAMELTEELAELRERATA